MISMKSGKHLLISITREMSALVKNGRHREALLLLSRARSSPHFPTIDAFLFPLALNCSAALRLPAAAAALHAFASKSGLLYYNPFISSALIDAYSKSSPFSISDAHSLFDELPTRNSIVWSSVIAAHARVGDYLAAGDLLRRMDVPPPASAFNAVISAAIRGSDPSAALSFLRQMQALDIHPTPVTALAIIPLCSASSSIKLAGEIHAFSLRHSHLPDFRLSSALVEAYGRCGRPLYSARVFDQVNDPDVVTWSALVSAYAFNGLGAAALEEFRKMAAAEVEPDGIMFLAVMKACSHAGMPDLAKTCMEMMVEEYGMEPGWDHYACLVDAMARAGRLEEAQRFAERKGSVKAWGALLGASRVHGDVAMAEAAARALVVMEPGNAANLVILSSVYAAAGLHEEAEHVREEIRARNMQRTPGGSWVSELGS